MRIARIDTVLRCWGTALLLALTAGCSAPPSEAEAPVTHTFTFEEGMEGWTGAFADYSTQKTAESLELTFDRRPLPEDVTENGMALFLSGRNESDDLFMFVKHEVGGLQPDTPYAITYELEIASDAPSGCMGIGGAPGEAVTLKVGAAGTEPEPVVEDGMYRMNVDKGNQAGSGEQAVVVGDIANGSGACTDTPYRMITRSNRDDALVSTTRSDGTLWVFVGTDSGFEGTTSLYYETIRLTLEPR